jgi:hypothetical protein
MQQSQAEPCIVATIRIQIRLGLRIGAMTGGIKGEINPTIPAQRTGLFADYILNMQSKIISVFKDKSTMEFRGSKPNEPFMRLCCRA